MARQFSRGYAAIWSRSKGWRPPWDVIPRLVTKIHPHVDADDFETVIDHASDLFRRYGHSDGLCSLPEGKLIERAKTIELLYEIDMQWADRFVTAFCQFFPSYDRAKTALRTITNECAGNRKFDELSRAIRDILR